MVAENEILMPDCRVDLVGKTNVKHPFNNESGMTLIEILFSIMILLVLTMTSASMIRNGIDLRVALSEQARVTHRVAIAMQRLTDDIQHAYMLSRNRQEYNYLARATKTIFATRLFGGSSTLRLTAMNHHSLRQGLKESDQSFVVYKVEKDRDTGLPHLYRGESQVLPEDFDEEPQMRILARYVKSFVVKPWNGDGFKEEWNSERSDWRDLLPQMVEIQLEAYDVDIDEEEERIDNLEDLPTVTVRTIVYLQRSWGNKEVKQPTSSVKWY